MSVLPAPADGANPPVYKAHSATPVKKSLQGSQRFGSDITPKADQLQINMAQELAGQWVGPMPVKEFLAAFLKLDADVLASIPDFKPTQFDSLEQEEHEVNMYDPFIAAVETSGALGDAFKLINTSDNPDLDAVTGMKNKPDVSCYHSELDVAPNPTNFEEMELVFEFKPYKRPADPFDDTGKGKDGVKRPFEPVSKKEGTHCLRERCRGQLACYTRVWSARQHRTHCFLLWLGDPHARLIRMDRSGGIVSQKFNYRTHGQLLLQFLWRFSRSTPEARGRDTTISKASLPDAQLAKALLTKANFSPDPETERTVYKVQVPDPRAETGMSPYLVWAPTADPESVTGRATRPYPAVDILRNNEIVFLKDSWRASDEDMEQEAAIIRELNAKGCRNVPTLVCGDDLDQQFTVTKDYAEEPWNLGGRSKKFVARVHTRFVQKEVGYHLDRFKSSRDLFQAVYDAVLAHRDAYEKCGILHRDISGGNVLMRQNGWGGGFLNDWDLAKHIHRDLVARQPFRSGTWQFMSAALLGFPYKINTLQDDLESFFWVILYYVLRYSRHSRVDQVRADMRRVFDVIYGSPGELAEGGAGKKLLFLTGEPLRDDFAVALNTPATHFIRMMLTLWEEWYNQLRAYDRLIIQEKETHRISKEEAVARLPFDDRNLAMRNHESLVQRLEAALAHLEWPINDEANDNFGKQRGRVLDSEEDIPGEGEPETENAMVARTARPMKKMKTSKKLDDDAYKPSTEGSNSSLTPPVFLSRETRPGNTKPIGMYAEEDSDDFYSE